MRRLHSLENLKMNKIETILLTQQLKGININNWFLATYYYMIDSKYRKKEKLKSYLLRQLKGASLSTYKLARSLRGKDEEETIINILKWVLDNFKYKSDMNNFGQIEKWEDIEITMNNRYGDCESLNGIIYVLCRLAGIGDSILYACIGEVWIPNINTNSFINMVGITNTGDKKWSFKKAINSGTIQNVLKQELKKVNIEAQKQNSKKDMFVNGKEKELGQMHSENMHGKLLKIKKRFVKIVEKLKGDVLFLITKIKIGLIILSLIYKYYVDLVTQDIMEKKVMKDNIKKVINPLTGSKKVINPLMASKKEGSHGTKELRTQGSGGHFWLLFWSTNFDKLVAIDSTYYPTKHTIKMRSDFQLTNKRYKEIWYIFNSTKTIKVN